MKKIIIILLVFTAWHTYQHRPDVSAGKGGGARPPDGSNPDKILSEDFTPIDGIMAERRKNRDAIFSNDTP